MLKQAQIDAESINPPISDGQMLTLTLLIKQYPLYARTPALWPDIEVKLQAEKDTPTVKTLALKAVLTALGKMPNLAVESQGSVKSPTFFSSPQNWGALAQDVLNTLYDIPIPHGSYNFALAQREIKKLTINEDIIITPLDEGRRY